MRTPKEFDYFKGWLLFFILAMIGSAFVEMIIVPFLGAFLLAKGIFVPQIPWIVRTAGFVAEPVYVRFCYFVGVVFLALAIISAISIVRSYIKRSEGASAYRVVASEQPRTARKSSRLRTKTLSSGEISTLDEVLLTRESFAVSRGKIPSERQT
jgi:hypothetical protein